MKAITGLIIGTALLSGCSGTSGKAANPTPPAAAKTKTPLAIPASFPDVAAKHDFAVKAVQDKYYREGAQLLGEVATVTPNDVSVYTNLGTARYNLKDYTGAVDAWTKAYQLDPSLQSEMLNNIGNAWRDARKLDDASASYKKAIETDAKNWHASVNLADLLRDQGKVDEAIKVVEAAMPANPAQPDLGRLADSLKKPATPATKSN